MADYGVNIKVGVQNTEAITALTRKIKLTTTQVDSLNNFLANFNDWRLGKAVVNSVDNFSKALKDARDNLNSAALGSREAADAARDFARAQDLANDALREQAELLARVRNEGRSGTLRGGTQYSGPAGPGFSGLVSRQASETALSSRLPPSVPVALRSPMRPQSLLPQMGMTAQAGKIASDMEDVYASILRLTEKTNQQEAERLQTIRNLTQEAQDLAKSYQVSDKDRTSSKQEQLRLQTDIARGIAKTKQQAAQEAEIASKDYMNRLASIEAIGKERRDQMIRADRELATEQKINAVFKRREEQAIKAEIRKRATGSALIGGAFPLLFGQGLGAAAGGAVGGFGGGMIGGEFGFGLSLVGTSIGSFIDQLSEKAVNLGKALQPLTADTQTIIEAVGKSNTEFAALIDELNDAGQSVRALELASRELEKVVGVDGVQALELFSDRIVDLQNDFAVLTTKIAALIATAVNAVTGETPQVRAMRDRSAAVFQARQSKDPEIAAAVAELDSLGPDPQLRIAQQEKIADLLEKGTEAERNRLRISQLAQKQGRDQARIVRSSTEITQLQVQLLQSGVHASSEQGAVIRRRIADLQEEQAITKAYKDFATDAISKDTLRATLTDARVTRELQYAKISKDVNNRITSLKDKENTRGKSAVTLGDRIEQQLKRQLSRYEEIDPIARKRAIIDADHLTIMERISTVQDDIKRKDLETLANSVRTARQNDLNQQIQDEATEKAERQTKLFENKLTSAEQEGRLLQATLDGREEEETLLIKIENLTKGMSAPRAEQLEYQLRQNETLKQQVEMAEKLDEMYKQIGSTLASSLSGALQSVINKTESLGDAVRGVLVDIGNMLLRMGIETAVKAGFSAITSSVGSSGGGGSTLNLAGVQAYMASGGYVSKPTNAVIGEGGQGEYVIPESKMRESMARYSRGARGSSVIPESGEPGTVGGGGGTAVAAPIDVRYTVERINDVEYVTAAQFQAGMQQAAAQGAQRGEQQTLRRLQMSGSTRRRIGL